MKCSKLILPHIHTDSSPELRTDQDSLQDSNVFHTHKGTVSLPLANLASSCETETKSRKNPSFRSHNRDFKVQENVDNEKSRKSLTNFLLVYISENRTMDQAGQAEPLTLSSFEQSSDSAHMVYEFRDTAERENQEFENLV